MRKVRQTMLGIGVATIALLATMAIAQEEDESVFEEIIVTASFISVERGGVQDINYLREQVSDGDIPLPEDFSIEGLLGEYAIDIPITKTCKQLLCLVGETAQTKLITQKRPGLLTAISFSSYARPDDFKDQALNLVAVVDRSGSMDGEPIELVKIALSAMVKQLDHKDQISIVSYGSDAELILKPTSVTQANIDNINTVIMGIEVNGGTNLEAGLIMGYAIAEKNLNEKYQRSRLMLFTDERPNIGNTDADGFIEHAVAYSEKGIGLTTIGIGDHFGNELATSVGSVRGGNVHFVRNQEDASRLFGAELNTMVSELAYDLDLLIEPESGYRISGVYGVPKDFLSWKGDGKVNLHLPTVFAGTKQGAIFVSMESVADEHLPSNTVDTLESKLTLRYLNPEKRRRSRDSLTLTTGQDHQPSHGMQLGSLLIDEYLVLKSVAQAHHWDNDQTKAYWLIRSLYHQFVNQVALVPEPEMELINQLYATVAEAAGYANEVLGE